MTTWDHSVDLVVVGSGGGGFVAALTADHAGSDVLLLEKRDVVGGSTAMSGGIVWIPNNRWMTGAGVPDSYDDAWAYFDAVVGDEGPWSSDERRRAFLTAGPQMLDFLDGLGVGFLYCYGYSDYYSELKGGRGEGRAVEPVPFDARLLGEWSDKLQLGLAADIGLAVKTNELRFMSQYNRSFRCLATAARVFARTSVARARRQKLVTNGAALIARMLQAALTRRVPIWTEAPVEELIVSDGRVVGVRTVKDVESILVEARKGVLLVAGGFGHNAEMRVAYSGDQPNDGRWSWANPGDTGETLSAAMELGAKTALLDEAWWLPTPADAELAASTLNMARQRPGAIFVDAAGQRFVNEPNSKMEVGKAMYARDKQSRAVPCWLILDDGYRRRYAHTKGLPGRFPKSWFERGVLKRAETLEELARQCDIDPRGLRESVERFNRSARNGLDPDFGRGQSAFNKSFGDPGYKLNPALGPLDRPPFYATQVIPTDIGTCGGLVCNEYAQVLDQQDRPIPGLYAAGNSTATVMGRHYLGGGASIADSMVFAHIAALHATKDEGQDLSNELTASHTAPDLGQQ
jgi:3-oxosteroid 1-dehydrogenase